MGEVYPAHDARLGRQVAVKVLPFGLATDSERLGRFEQEARAAAPVNHPNILAMHDIGQHDGAPYIVTELLALILPIVSVLVDDIIPTARVHMFLTLEAVVVLGVGALICRRYAPRAAEAL